MSDVRLINRDELLKALSAPNKMMIFDWNVAQETSEYGIMMRRSDVIGAVMSAPAVDAVLAVHGRWELFGADKRGRGGVFNCTACNRCRPTKSDYCPNCGAKMDLKELEHEG